MKRIIFVIGLIISVLLTFSAPAQADGCTQVGLQNICATVVGQDVVITVQGQEILRIKGPVGTVEIQVPVPGPTQFLPGPVRTILVPQPTPVPGPTRTIIMYVYRTGPTVVVTPSPTVTPKLTPTVPSATLSSTPEPQPTPSTKIVNRDRTVTKTIEKIAEIGLLVIIGGILLALIALGITYVSGYRDAKRQETEKLQSLKDELF